jgi:hypothetical protein
MAFQLIYTSAPRLLQAGRTGFGTVAKHSSIRGALQSEIERFSQFSRQEGLNPNRVIYQYRCLSISGMSFHVISRLKDAGSDYTGRTNHLAHHIIFSSAEAHSATVEGITPVDVVFNLNSTSFWCDSWHVAPIEFGPQEEISLTSIKPAISLPAVYWKALTGTPDSAAILAPGQTAESCWLIYAPSNGEHLLAQIGESLLLHPNPWRISFASEFQPTDRVEEIAWRAIPSDSPLCLTAAQSVRPILDLTRPETLPPPVPEFTSIASYGRHQQIEPKGHPGLITAPSPASSMPGAGLPPTIGRQPVPLKPDENTTVPGHRQSLTGLKRQTEKNAPAKARLLIPINLTITAALAAVVLATGACFFYVLPKMQREHKAAQDRYEVAIDNFLHTTGIKVQQGAVGEEPSVKDLETAAALLETATRNYENTPLALKDIEVLNANQTQNTDLHSKLITFGNLLVTNIFSRVEAQCLLATRNGKIEELKNLIAIFDQNPEIRKLLEDAQKKKLEQFITFISNWDGREYPAIIDFLHEKQITNGKAASEVDENYARVLNSNPATELSKLEAITDKTLIDYPTLSKRKSILTNPPKADAGISKPNPTQPPKSLGETPAVVTDKPAESPPPIKWRLLPDRQSYVSEISAQSSKTLGLLKNPTKAGLTELLKSPTGEGLKQVTFVAAKNDAAASPFLCVLNDKQLPDVVIVNCESFTNQPISRDLIDATAGVSLVINEPLFRFLSSRSIETTDGNKVLFYFEYQDGEEQQILDKTISAEADLANARKQIESIENERAKQLTPPSFPPEAQKDIEKWLGPKGAFNNLDIGNKSNDFTSYLQTKLKVSSNTSLLEMLYNDESKKLTINYIKDMLNKFKTNKGTTYSTDPKNKWTHEMSDSINPVANAFSTSSTISESFVAATNQMSSAPIDIVQLFSKEYLASAKALDTLFESYSRRKEESKRLETKKAELDKKAANYGDLSKSIVFFAKNPNDRNGARLIEFKIEPTK